MDALQQKCRPKHQVLVLKCYPRTTKGAVDVKPNSSELSYLLFYAQSRRSKIQKVGGFLEKKTASDVYRQRIGNVQVTLQILTALIEKAPKDLPLFAPTVLKVLEQILKSNDITMVESSIPTFEAFCENHDPTSLLADQAYSCQYVSVVRHYASLASTRFSLGKVPPSKPLALRWRNAGLEAIRSIASSEALSSIPGRQYDVLVPMILENLWTDNEDFLDVLLHRAQSEEKTESGGLIKRRTSNVTVHTVDTSNALALAGTAVDVDKLAEEDIGVLAMQCLKQIFVVPNRSQIQVATRELLKFIEERVSQGEEVVRTNPMSSKDGGWAIKMFGLVSRWAPVQDRYTILITAIETMGRMPLSDESLQQHSVLAAMIGFLLRSDQNLIGLSVMDVLAQLIGHMKRLVQMPGDPSTMKSDASPPGQVETKPPATVQSAERVERATRQRKRLLQRLQNCVGDLATHVYYADQISDMISAIFAKLRPSRSTSPSSSSPQGERTEAQVAPASDDHLDSLLSLSVAKAAALKSIKSILSVANLGPKTRGNISLARNRVPIQVWEGTQWLLRDPDGNVRKAYADALVAWLDRETTPADLQARDDSAVWRTTAKNRDVPPSSMARRAVSSASSRIEKPLKTARSHFLPLLHLAIYDNALQYIDYEADIVLLHILLAQLVNHLGVNAVRFGLPMIFRLQEDIQDAETPLQKVRLGSLVHCYFWALTDKFDFEATVVGRAIHNEIVRRRSKHFWVEGVHVPAPAVELIGTPGIDHATPKMPSKEVESEALLPFDDRLALVDCICTGYQERVNSPPASPPVSPGRNLTHPLLTSALSTMPSVAGERELPAHLRDEMLAEWSREAVLEAVQATSKSASLNGSRSGTTGNNRKPLGVQNGVVADALTVPIVSQTLARKPSRPVTSSGPFNGLTNKTRQSSVGSKASHGPDSVSSRLLDVASVEQLKRVLSGRLQAPSGRAPYDDVDDSSDSMISFDKAPSDLSFNTAPGEATVSEGKEDNAAAPVPKPSSSRPNSRDRKASAGSLNGPLSSHPTVDIVSKEKEDDTASPHAAKPKNVPPVPPLPQGMDSRASALRSPALMSPVLQQHQHQHQHQPATLPRPTTDRHSVKSQSQRSRRSERLVSRTWSTHDGLLSGSPTIDLAALLKGIDSHAGERSLGPVTKPPY